MKKALVILMLVITPLLSTPLLAADSNSPDAQELNKNKSQQKFDSVLGKVVPPSPLAKIGAGEEGINKFLGTIVQLIFLVATVGFVFMVLLSATQMILSGGDKEALGKARGRLTWAIIGIVLLSLSFVIFRVLSDITGFNFTL